jgi:hypothetical protein
MQYGNSRMKIDARTGSFVPSQVFFSLHCGKRSHTYQERFFFVSDTPFLYISGDILLFPSMPKKNRPYHADHTTEKQKNTASSFWKRPIAVIPTLFIVLAAVYVLATQYFSATKNESPPPMTNIQHQDSLNLFDRTVQRAYAIDVLAHQLYNNEWEGATGAIGDAYLYAATGDSRLLELYTHQHRLLDLHNGTWVDDRAWVCLAELTWWDVTGRKNKQWVDDARRRYLDARREGRLSHHEGFWSWYNYYPGAQGNYRLITNTNMNQMATVACWLYEATHEQQFYSDALLIWNGDATNPGVEKKFYYGNGIWKGNEGRAAFGKQFPWEGAGMCTIGAALYRMTHEKKYKDIVVATARRIMDPANGWVDPQDFYQIRMDGNGAFVHFIADAYLTAPDQLPDIPDKIARMLEHVWTNHHGTALTTLHRPIDDGIRNGWNPNGGEDGYHVDEVGTVHAQSEALRAFGVFAYIVHEMKTASNKGGTKK